MLSSGTGPIGAFIADDRGAAVVEYALVCAALFLATYGAMAAVNSTAATQLVGTQSSLTCTSVYAAPGTTASVDGTTGNLTCTAVSPRPASSPAPPATAAPPNAVPT